MEQDNESISDGKQKLDKHHVDEGRSVIRGPKNRDLKNVSEDKNQVSDVEDSFHNKHGDNGQ
jgi:hypothetical protein